MLSSMDGIGERVGREKVSDLIWLTESSVSVSSTTATSAAR